MGQKCFFYEDHISEGFDVFSYEAGLIGEPKITDTPTECVYCSRPLYRYVSMYDNTETAYPYPAYTDRTDASIHRLYVCYDCGWWWDQQERFNESNDYFSDSAVLRSFDICSNSIPLETIRSYLLQKWGDRRHISAQKAEELVASVFKEHMDCEILYLTDHVYAPDGGIDFVLINNTSGERFAVQVKRRQTDQPESVQEVLKFVGALVRQDYSNGLFVTTADRFTRPAREAELAPELKKRNIFLKLYDGSNLFELLKLYTQPKPRNLPRQLTIPDKWIAVDNEDDMTRIQGAFQKAFHDLLHYHHKSVFVPPWPTISQRFLTIEQILSQE
jgi:restriction system protein